MTGAARWIRTHPYTLLAAGLLASAIAWIVAFGISSRPWWEYILYPSIAAAAAWFQPRRSR